MARQGRVECGGGTGESCARLLQAMVRTICRVTLCLSGGEQPAALKSALAGLMSTHRTRLSLIMIVENGSSMTHRLLIGMLMTRSKTNIGQEKVFGGRAAFSVNQSAWPGTRVPKQ